MDDALDRRLEAGRAAMRRPRAARRGAASRGRSARPTAPSPSPTGARRRSSPTSPRWCRTGSARSRRILAAPADEPVPFGRVATDPARIERIGRDRALPAGELFDRIDRALARRRRRAAAARPGRRGAARRPPAPRRDDGRGDRRAVHRRPPRGPRPPARGDPRRAIQGRRPTDADRAASSAAVAPPRQLVRLSASTGTDGPIPARRRSRVLSPT